MTFGASQAFPKDTAAEPSVWLNALQAFLTALEWKGDVRSIYEALPSPVESLTIDGFRDAMAHLGFESLARYGNPRRMDVNRLPAIWFDKAGQPHVLLKPEDRAAAPDKMSRLLWFVPIKTSPVADPNTPLLKTLKRFHPLLLQAFLLSLVIGVLALAPTFFNMAIYDYVIASGSPSELGMLSVGVMIGLIFEIGIRHLRARRLAYFGARIDHLVSCAVFERLLFLPPSFTERASVSAQLARLRDFASVREFFTGPLSSLFFEMPLIGVYIIVMAVLSHWLALVPLFLMLAYGGLLWIMNGRVRDCARASSDAMSLRHEFLLETVTRLRAIRLSGMEDVWQKRWRKVSSAASIASFRAGYVSQIVEVASYVLMTLGGVATLGFGVMAVIDQHLTAGALIASMMLIWRIVAPMQVACSSITRLQQLGASSRQVQRLLSMPPEHDPYAPPVQLSNGINQLSFYRVTLRYTQDTEPAVLGVSFEARPGQIIAIRGGNGSGKSSILKLALGLYQPQGGSVRLGGVDIRQLDPQALRQSMAYVPQNVDLFPGSVRENLLLAYPAADEAACMQALETACALEEVMRLPKGIDTVICGDGAEKISFLLKQRLNLARAYLKPSPIMLFDEASHSLGKENDIAFANVINGLRGRCTVVLVTHREDHMMMADTLLVLNNGELTHAGPPDQVLTVLRGKRL
jgi:ATP-binding cassette subfamily C protein/ATP-binding cassette subfamily C protein LapB